jgi:hypothetical protein
VAGVKEGTRRGELIAAIGVGVSVVLGVTGVFIGAVAGGWLQKFFPEWLIHAFNTYLLPGVFGAVFGEFALRGFKYAPVALVFSLLPLWLGWKAYFAIPIAVIGTMLFGWIAYKQFGWGAPKAEAAE